MLVHVGRRDLGTAIPEGHLPVFAVGSQREADLLVEQARRTGVMAWTNSPDHVGVAVMLTEEQTLDSLYDFGWELKKLHDEILVPAGQCDCDPRWWDAWCAREREDERDDEWEDE